MERGFIDPNLYNQIPCRYIDNGQGVPLFLNQEINKEIIVNTIAIVIDEWMRHCSSKMRGSQDKKKTKNTKNQIEAQIQNNKKKRQRTSGFWSNCTNQEIFTILVNVIIMTIGGVIFRVTVTLTSFNEFITLHKAR